MLDVLKGLLLATGIIVIAAAMVPRGHALHHLTHPGVWSRVVRNHANRKELTPAAANTTGLHSPPRSSWHRGIEMIAQSVDTRTAGAAVRLRAPPFSA